VTAKSNHNMDMMPVFVYPVFTAVFMAVPPSQQLPRPSEGAKTVHSIQSGTDRRRQGELCARSVTSALHTMKSPTSDRLRPYQNSGTSISGNPPKQIY
jgi:hypothetical protein